MNEKVIQIISDRKETLKKIVFWSEQHKLAYQKDIDTLLSYIQGSNYQPIESLIASDSWENEGGAN